MTLTIQTPWQLCSSLQGTQHPSHCILLIKTTTSPSRFQGRWIDYTFPWESSKADFRKAFWMGYIWWPSFGNIVCHHWPSGQNNSYRMAYKIQPHSLNTLERFILFCLSSQAEGTESCHLNQVKCAWDTLNAIPHVGFLPIWSVN